MTQSSLLRPKSFIGLSGFEKSSTLLPCRIYNTDGFSMRLPRRIEAKRTGGNRPSGKPDIQCQETTIIRDESRKYFPSNAPIESPAPSNSAIDRGAGRDPHCGRARGRDEPSAPALAVRPDRGGSLYRAAPRDGHQRVVQPQPRSHHAGFASGRLRRLQLRLGPGPGEFRLEGGADGFRRARALQRAARARLSRARGAPISELSLGSAGPG